MSGPNKQSVISLWRASELLTIPEIPELNEGAFFYATKYGRLPWESNKTPRAPAGKILFYVVYLGEIGKAEAHARMANAFGAAEDEDDYRHAREFDAECYSALLFLNEDGKLLDEGKFEPFQIADHVLGYAQKRNPIYTDEKFRGLRKKFKERFAPPIDADRIMQVDAAVSDSATVHEDPAVRSAAFNWEMIDREERYLRDLAPDLFAPWPERILIRRVEASDEDALAKLRPLGLMPNFYMDDLERIGGLLPSDNHGALEHILNGPDVVKRSDILNRGFVECLCDLLAAEKMPPARWPSNPEHHLMMGQQAAVNSIWELSDVKKPELRAVNGPPGTGKTTLLRDVIANIITKRAFVMANADDSSKLFETVKINGHQCLLPIAELGDSGIVVTSNNNSAVENISNELPDDGAIDETFKRDENKRDENFKWPSFLPRSGTAILNARKDPKEHPKDAWGSISAALGNSGNRSAFAKAWHPKPMEKDGEVVPPPLGRDLEATDGKATFEEAKEYLSACRKRVTEMQKKMTDVAYCSGAPVPEGVTLTDLDLLRRLPESQRQLLSFNVNKEFEIARAELFLAALDLHRAALSENYGRLRGTLTLCNTMVGSKSDEEILPHLQRRLWDLLFLCVPVVSTSLASISRMFAPFQGGQIPWLMIDEAGQATAASAAGALWRAKRAVIVGDPLQVEPVATFEDKSVSAIAKALGVGKDLNPAGNSVQTMADCAMSVGAYIGVGENKVWGGLPLRAHRRCADPMFSVANEIAYGNQMVQANKNGAELDFPLGESCWIDVASLPSDGHVNKPEIDFVKKVRKWLADEVSAKRQIPSVFFISPFKKVAVACGGRKIKGVEAGSVHAFQGKEAEAVFIVLGSAAGRRGVGSRKWAGQAPNILNVALTRAKKRAYIVGSIADWSGVPNFSTLARYMKESGQVISVEEALDRFQENQAASEGGGHLTSVVSDIPKKEVMQSDKELSVARLAERDSVLEWRPLSKIWEEMGSMGSKEGFRVVKKDWQRRHTGLQYTLVTERNVSASNIGFSGSYTVIKKNLEERWPVNKISKPDEPVWVTLEEVLSGRSCHKNLA
ncbi:DEAD/DEAH box helicase [Celeribacter litoreus]|uniref:DEAD/DEAH box helicase n=1 Tax=Celeribacter litoreus TaxID=2876714 RepID=UPI001CCA10FF|nr:AAA domain-containing protein [Celeribacter litoreus]MCA0044648.1 hypothetical protein [Celeribacter litoreus]